MTGFEDNLLLESSLSRVELQAAFAIDRLSAVIFPVDHGVLKRVVGRCFGFRNHLALVILERDIGHVLGHF